jgi:hypothetical protein
MKIFGISLLNILFVIGEVHVAHAAMNHVQSELCSIPWGDSAHQIYYYNSDELVIPSSAALLYLDKYENIYIPYDREDFRKFDKSGNLVYKIPLYIVNSAVNNDGYVFYEYLGGLDTVRIIDPAGNILPKQFVFSDFGDDCWILDIIERNANILYCGYSCTFQLTSTTETQINYQLDFPRDSRGYYYLSLIDAMRGHRTEQECYHKQFLDIDRTRLKPSLSYAALSRDTIRIENIGSHPLEGAEVLGVDDNDNLFIWLFYGFTDYPMEMAVLSGHLVEQYRFVFKSYQDSKDLIWRPQVQPDGTVYEFRVEEDGVHIIKWTRQ